jgi:phage gpG-like protein
MEGEKIIKDLEKLVKQYIDLTISDIRVEASEMFDKNFQREAFFNEKWARRKFNDDDTRNILTKNGTLRTSILSKVEGNKIVFETTVPYAAIHNEGGTIVVTHKMKMFFRAKCYEALGLKRKSKANLERKKRVLSDGGFYAWTQKMKLTKEAEFWRAMALKPIGSKIVIPKRQFIGTHPELEAAIFEIAEKNAIKIFKDV